MCVATNSENTVAAKRVLVVDDDEVIRDTLTMLLTDAGHTVESCACGALVVEMVQTWHPDIVLLDVLMAPVDGFSVLTALRAAHLVPALPVILLSGYLTGTSQRQIQLLGARGFISKPPDFDRLLALIAKPPVVWPGV